MNFKKLRNRTFGGYPGGGCIPPRIPLESLFSTPRLFHSTHNRPQATTTETVYTHAAEPRAAKGKGRYRDPNEAPPVVPANNIMYDRRVVRGNTYAAQIVPTDTLVCSYGWA